LTAPTGSSPPSAPRPAVLLIAPQPFYEWRGSPIRVGFDAMALAGLGFDVDLLVMPVGAERAIPGVRVFRAPNPLRFRTLPIGPSARKALLDVFLLARALGLAGRRRYAVVHGIEDAGPIAALAARRCGARVVFEKHSDPASYRGGLLRNLVMAAYRQAEAFSVRRADAVIATGPGLVEQVRRTDPGKPAHHIPDIPSSLAGADAERAAEVRRGWLPAPDALLALYVGSFAAYQGLDLVFGSVPLVRSRDRRVHYIVIGGSGAEIDERRRWLEARGCADAVTFAPKVPPDELPSSLAAADLLLAPRIAGTNTPLKLLDYLKAGRAVVATDHPANRQILAPETAELVSPLTPEAFAEGILRLAADPARRTALAAAGAKLLAGTYNFAEFQRRLRACYAPLVPGL
jgi:glycosyltransferase involved in cell wall biosynthesis